MGGLDRDRERHRLLAGGRRRLLRPPMRAVIFAYLWGAFVGLLVGRWVLPLLLAGLLLTAAAGAAGPEGGRFELGPVGVGAGLEVGP